jgi:hypothetical protein
LMCEATGPAGTLGKLGKIEKPSMRRAKPPQFLALSEPSE